MQHLRAEIERGEKKLGNEAFVAKAAPSVVAKEREKLEAYRSELARVEVALAELKERRMTRCRIAVWWRAARRSTRIVARLAHQIVEPNEAERGLVLLGVRRGGEALAMRLAGAIERISGRAPALGFLNINLYRDDRVSHELPESQIPQSTCPTA